MDKNAPKNQKNQRPADNRQLWNIGLNTIQELESDRGILASAKEEIYGCIFGRDSLITALKLLRAYHKTQDKYFLNLVEKILFNLADLQGKAINIESGEEPGKIIHEFRPEKHEHLTNRPENAWYLYEDRIMRNYDSVDSTSLFLITVARFLQLKSDNTDFYARILPSVELAFAWLETYGDNNQDGFIDYRFHPDRKFGGLRTQNWMDSRDSVFHEDNRETPYPIAPVEAQAYTYLAFRLWADYFKTSNPKLAQILTERADRLKKKFNEKFIVDEHRFTIASALDGNLEPMMAVRSSMGHILWAAQAVELDGVLDSILDEKYIPELVRRILSEDLFEPEAGIRTLSKHSSRFSPNSYHNGSIWPHDTAMIAEGLSNFGYHEEAERVRKSLILAWNHFGTPIELFVYDDNGFAEYSSYGGKKACLKQAWSAASLLAEISF